MFTYVSRDDFIDTFRRSRTYKNNFSYDALDVLFEHLEQLEEDTQEDIEFDMVAIACEYYEYKNTDDATALDQLNKDYGLEYETLEDLQADALIIPYTKSYSPVNTEGSMGSPQEYDGFVVHDVEVGGWYTHG